MSQCSITDEVTGSVFDLSKLTNSKEDYTYTSTSGTVFSLNVCGPIVTETWKIDYTETLGGFMRTEAGDLSLGQFGNLSLSTNGNPQLIFAGGASCLDGGLASTAINFVCSTTSSGPILTASLPPGADTKACAFVFDWKTPEACPKARHTALGNLGAVLVLGGLVVLAILAYFLGTLLYNRFILKLSGRDLLPTIKFPSFHLPKFSNPFKRSGNSAPRWRSASRGYTAVSAREDDEEDGLVGRFSIDDEDDVDEDARALSSDAGVWRNEAANGANGNGGSNKSGLINL